MICGSRWQSKSTSSVFKEDIVFWESVERQHQFIAWSGFLFETETYHHYRQINIWFCFQNEGIKDFYLFNEWGH